MFFIFSLTNVCALLMLVARYGGTKSVWNQESLGKKAFVRVSPTGSLSNHDRDMIDYRLFTYRTLFFINKCISVMFCLLYSVCCRVWFG